MENQNKPKNPNAFPIEYQNGEFQAGMTLRDYFANSAMQGIMSSYHGSASLYIDIKNSSNNLAKESYRIADAMLKEREKATE